MDFQQGADGIRRSESEVSVSYPVVVEQYDLEKFQKEGHFVPRMVDAEQNPRGWDGPLVWIGEVFNVRKDMEGTVIRKRLLRVLADSPEELERLIDLRMKETFFAMWLAGQQSPVPVASLQEENARLLEKIQEYEKRYPLSPLNPPAPKKKGKG